MYNPHIRWKIAFFEVKCHFWAFSHKYKNHFFVEYSTGVEFSTVKFLEKTYESCDIYHKYLEVTLITYENIQCQTVFFFNLTVGWYRDFKHVAFLVFVVFWASLLLFFRILKSEGCCYSLYFSHTTPCWEVILLWVHAPAGEGGGCIF